MSSRAHTRSQITLLGALCVVLPNVALGEDPRLIGVNRIDQLAPSPAGARPDIDTQPIGVPVPIFEVISNEAIADGRTSTTGTATAIVYRNSHDTGIAHYNKADVGNFTGNLLHLGNGFPVDGGEISGYDLLIYNSVDNPESFVPPIGESVAEFRVALWDGDPLGWIDTRNAAVPAPIPGTTCTFAMPYTGFYGSEGCQDTDDDGIGDTCVGGFSDGLPCDDDDTDCGLCPALPGDDIPDCPGLYRLVCPLQSKVMIPSRNVWMIVEYLGGCRMGWRWGHIEGPETAAAGEENFCDGTCPTYGGPCVDLAIEMVDAASQWNSMGVGTCCEDPGFVCDHSDGTYECGHPTTCSDGMAETFDAWCFGAPTQFASFVASVYANTDTTVTLKPVSASGMYRFDGDEIIMPEGGQTIELEVFVAGWDPDMDGDPAIATWMAQIDSSTYTSSFWGSLTNSRPPCTVDSDCPHHLKDEECVTSYCAGAWIEYGRSPLTGWLPACDVSGPNPRCGSPLWEDPLQDPGTPVYAMSARVETSSDAKGTFEVGLLPDPGTFMKDQYGTPIPLVGLIPAKITIELGQCCDWSVPYPFICYSDTVTAAECEAIGGTFNPRRTCNDSCECLEDWECDDYDVCTDDHCGGWTCSNAQTSDPATECCHPETGEICTLSDDNACTQDTCSLWPTRGDCLHTAVPNGTTCSDDEPCLTVNDSCEDGECIGVGIESIACTTDAECEALTQGLASCDQESGFCRCVAAECAPPAVVAEGPRYLAVIPADDYYPVAIRAEGVDPHVSCVVGYVQMDGRLRQPDYSQGEVPEDHAVYLPTGRLGWDVAHVRGAGVVSGATYEIRADCDPDHPGDFLSTAVSIVLHRQGDVCPVCGTAGVVDFVDISMVVDGFRSTWATPVCCTTDADCAVFGPTAMCNTDWPGCETPVQTPGRCQSITANLDLVGAFGCTPDAVIDFNDIGAAVDAFRSLADPCGDPCP